MTNDKPKAPKATEVEMYISNNWGDNSLINDWKAEDVQGALEEFADEVLKDKIEVFDECKRDFINMANKYEALHKELADKQAEIDRLKTIMVAAAEEIKEFWPAHCDEEGYGPANLMRRLETGLGGNYSGYSAGAFNKTRSEFEELKAMADKMYQALVFIQYSCDVNNIEHSGFYYAAKEAVDEYESIDKGNKSK